MPAEDHVFGFEHKIHPVTKMLIENGRGALTEQQQGYLHLYVIKHHHGKDAMDAMKKKLDAFYQVVKDEAAAVEAGAPLPEPHNG